MPTLPGLLLLHGAGDNGACWGPFASRLLAEPGLAGLPFATPDAPAHGGRRLAPGATLDWRDLLAAGIASAEALVAETGGPIVVAGHSMGAMMALGVSAHRPDLVVATFLEDPPLQAPLPPADTPAPGTDAAEPADLSQFHAWFATLQAQPLEAVVAGARAEHPDWDPGEYEPWARAKQAVDLQAWAEPVVFVHGETGWILRHAKTPVVLVAGLPERGSLVAPVAEQGLRALPGWTVHRLPAGHDVRRDAPAQTVALLADLLRTVVGPDGTGPTPPGAP
ncbi:MAG TPA: alpha/beta hydrolase [Candidatus Nanopelagicales bacterium]